MGEEEEGKEDEEKEEEKRLQSLILGMKETLLLIEIKGMEMDTMNNLMPTN